jgi:hypothetical protein
MINKEKYEELRNLFYEEENKLPKDVKTYYSKNYKENLALYYPANDKEILDLLEDEEFVKSLSPTELGYLVTNLKVDIPMNFYKMYRTLCIMVLSLQLLPELSDKIHIYILYNFYTDNFYCDLYTDIKNCYEIGYYKDDLIKEAKNIFYLALDSIKMIYWEYHLKELDISNITYEEYAITIEHIIEKGKLETEDWYYWKDAVARHLPKDLAEELYHL